MGIKEWYVRREIKGMSKKEKNLFLHQMVDEFLGSMPISDKKELIKELVPQIMNQMMDGLTPADKKEVMESIMPVIAFQLASEGGLSMLIGSLMSMTKKKKPEDDPGPEPKIT
jgi:hypothetical protein